MGRRETEPQSAEITYLHDVLTYHFPHDRTIWDFHHYFQLEADPEKILDIQYGISFFCDLEIPEALPWYKAWKYENRLPTLAINVLSDNTWQADLTEIVDYTMLLGIPVFLVFSAYPLSVELSSPPFLRVYFLKKNGNVERVERREIVLVERGEIVNPKGIIDLGGLPFQVGLMQLKRKFQGGSLLYCLAIFNKEGKRLLFQTKQ